LIITIPQGLKPKSFCGHCGTTEVVPFRECGKQTHYLQPKFWRSCATIFAMRPTVILLSFNSEATLAATLTSARQVSDEIFVVDSFSTDGTVEIARSLGATVVQHAFEHYGAQRNWAIDNLPISRPWQLHLDADEWMDDRLVAAIQSLPDEPGHAGYFIPRYLRFLGRVLRHGAMSPTWHLRLFRAGAGRCEDRKYDQHFLLTSGTSGKLPGEVIDDIRMSLSEWTARHNRWSDAEVAELGAQASQGRLKPDLCGNPAQRKRFLRRKYDRMPLFVRALGLFVYRFFFRLGCLDGTEGMIFWVLQSFWFRFLIDAKIWEKRYAPRLAEEAPIKPAL
jgi:glycosyltransferase involved in cell wall biosynthesis